MHKPPSPDSALIAELYKVCLQIRRVEEEIVRLYPSDKVKSPVHLSIGQESVSVGACSPLAPEDVVFSTYRSHAAYLARGGNLAAFWAELYGKVDGCARGKAGSMHMIDLAVNFMGTSAIVATSIPNSVGYALALQQRRRSAIVLSFFGDGATDEGAFHESLNFAALKKLPIIFVCENNGYAIYSPTQTRVVSANYCDRARAYGIAARSIENGDVFAVREAVAEARRAILEQGSGPVFIEVKTCRWRDHVGVDEDFHLGYRSPDECGPWKEKDEIARLRAMLPLAEADAIAARVEAEIAAAIGFAENSPFPEPSELLEHIVDD